MNMPGFTAEASLDTSREHYHLTTRWNVTDGQAVAPQLTRSLGRCIPNCICVTDEGCPCCMSIQDLPGALS
jgi:hypothetical protein